LTDALILYNQIIGFTKTVTSSNKKNYWRIATGRNGILWRIWKEENFCSIGYHQYEPYLQELLQIQDKNTFYTRLIQIARENENIADFSFMLSSQPYAHQNTLWSFFHEMKIGDIIIASTGRTQVYGIGTIASNISIRDANDYSLIRM
jgi:predicted Mrr-cat superfamily restriction endonuclease